MCCKLLGIRELNKEPNTWCPHCAVGSGCRIYADRPKVCHVFNCFWLQHPELFEELRPDRTKVILWEPEDAEGRLVVNIEPSRWDSILDGEMGKLLNYLVGEGYVIGVTDGERRRVLCNEEQKEWVLENAEEAFKILKENDNGDV